MAMTDYKNNPYLSVVITSRNDEHGGNPLARTQISFTSLLNQLEKYQLASELILVDWNPPPDKPLLKDAIKWPRNLKYCTIRYIVVPPYIHQRYKNHDKIPLHTLVAVNSGLRRARGEFLLPGVINLLYSDELIAFIASRKLREDERYRVERVDVDRNLVQCGSHEEQIEYAKHHIIRINTHLHDAVKYGLPDLHTNACGDFQLMSKKYWHLLRGYREADLAASHVDGILSNASYAAGVKEIFLDNPMRVYHIDHDEKFTQRIETPKFEKYIYNPLIPKSIRIFYLRKSKPKVFGLPVLSYLAYIKLCQDMIKEKRSFIINGENWGLGTETLEETVIA